MYATPCLAITASSMCPRCARVHYNEFARARVFVFWWVQVTTGFRMAACAGGMGAHGLDAWAAMNHGSMAGPSEVIRGFGYYVHMTREFAITKQNHEQNCICKRTGCHYSTSLLAHSQLVVARSPRAPNCH